MMKNGTYLSRKQKSLPTWKKRILDYINKDQAPWVNTEDSVCRMHICTVMFMLIEKTLNNGQDDHFSVLAQNQLVKLITSINTHKKGSLFNVN